ncbi:MAG: dTDP-glucose 4,6-dehydratase [Deltaproteobacteria bacterium]|nr:dTDP-glucose 4,6-dehydratase [Deltaproteobacteria bacterium]
MSRTSVLITGGAGFIGSNLCRYWVTTHPEHRVTCFDKLTYAGNLSNIADLIDAGALDFIRGDVADAQTLHKAFERIQPDLVIHLAAETHVDRSLVDPQVFVKTNVLGTATLLEASWDLRRRTGRPNLILHMSTDEVFGSTPKDQSFDETAPYRPASPYSAAKAGADMLVGAYHTTWSLPVAVVHPSNNFGPYQFPEKLIPLMVHNIISENPLPIYGNGRQQRDWIYVEDLCRALDRLSRKAEPGQHYNVATGRLQENIDLVRGLCDLTDARLGRNQGSSRALITHIEDRPGHDLRYALDVAKMTDLGWSPKWTFEAAIEATVDWYLSHREWVENVTSGAYRDYYDHMYGRRLSEAATEPTQ